MKKKKQIFPFKMIDANLATLHAQHHTSTKVIYITVLAIVIVALFAMPYISLPVTSQSRGMIHSEQDNNTISSALYGQLEELYIKENMFVQKGDTLCVLNSSKLKEQIKLNQEKIKDNNRFISDLREMLSNKSLDNLNLLSPLYIQELLQFQQTINEKELRVVHQERELERAEALLQTGTIARAEKEQKEHSLLLAKNSLDVNKKQQRKAWQLELNRYKAENRDLQSAIKQTQEEQYKYTITAPIDGVITNLSGLEVGNFVAPNQAIAHISSHDELIVESYVTPSDIGLIQAGMDVNFQIDAFNYNQWGLATGRVTEVSSDITTVGEQPFFVVKCSLDAQSLSLTNGYEGKFKKGMTLTARYAITNRTLYQLLYDKMDDWLNPVQG